MKPSAWLALGVGLALIGATAAFILRQKAVQRLGRPGLKVAAMPVYGQDHQVAGTNGLTLIGSNSVVLPEQVLDYQSQVLPVSRVVFEWLPRDTVYGTRAYVASNGFTILNTVVLMGADRSSIHKPQYCLPAQGHQIIREESDAIRVERPHPYDLPVVKILTAGQLRDRDGRVVPVRGVYIYWFVADGQITSNHAQMQWWMARDLLRHGVQPRWAYVTYMAFCTPGQEGLAYERLKRFIAASVPEFQLTVGPPLSAGPASGPRR